MMENDLVKHLDGEHVIFYLALGTFALEMVWNSGTACSRTYVKDIIH